MRKRSWLVAMLLCVPSLAAAQADAPVEQQAEPSDAQTERLGPPAPEDDALYPPPAPAGPEGVARSYAAQASPRAEPDPYQLSVHQKYSLKIDLLAQVPIPVTDDNDSSRVGFGIAALFGWDFGFLLPSVGVGWSWSRLNLPPGYRDDTRSLKRFHMSLGLVAEFENESIVTPVLGALVDFNFWHVAGDDGIVCGGYYYWGCYQVENYRYTTGFTLRAGIDVRLFRDDRFSLGAGVQPQVTLQGGPFTQAEWWLSPYALFTFRN